MITNERILELIKRPNALDLIKVELDQSFLEGYRQGQCSMRARIAGSMEQKIVEATWPIEYNTLIK